MPLMCTKSVSQKIERRVGTKKCNFFGPPQPPVHVVGYKALHVDYLPRYVLD